MSRRSAESRRLAVSSTLPRLSRQPSIATARPENSPTPCRRPPSRGNWSPTRASHASRLPMARRVSTVSASSSASSTLSLLGSTRELANIVQAAERGPQAGAHGFHHLGRQRLAVVDFAGVEAGLDPLGSGLSQRRRPRERRPASGPFRIQEARACVCPWPLTTAMSPPRPSPHRSCRGRALHRHPAHFLGSGEIVSLSSGDRRSNHGDCHAKWNDD